MYSITKVIVFALFITLSANSFATTNNNEQCLAETIYHEARGTSIEEQRDIAKIVINRTKHNKFPKTICSVIYHKNQFKWVKNKLKIKDKKSWEESKLIAKQIIKNPRLSTLPENAVFFKTKKSKNFLANNLIKVKVGIKHKHSFFAMKG